VNFWQTRELLPKRGGMAFADRMGDDDGAPCAPSWSPQTAWLSQKPQIAGIDALLGAEMRSSAFLAFFSRDEYCNNGGMAFAR
jgi:hypothetical protein